eukprot:GFYU01013308.1.p1 GENE.GFYU01013308.1~~GFYU01013308.1.p1  ORF type:complete len:133 (-),score=25.16 GFYU01013308.1:605-1003(-)
MSGATSAFALPGTASLAEEVDKRVLIVLRDGRKLLGTLRSYDQYANLVLENTIERVVSGEKFGDIPLGLYLIRGENVALIGELDLEKAAVDPPGLTRVSIDDILRAKEAEQESKEAQKGLRQQINSMLEEFF